MIRKNSILRMLTSADEVARLDNDYFIIEIKALDFPKIPILNHLYQVSVCHSGTCQSRVNLRPVTHQAGSVGFGLPGQVVEIISVSDDYEATLIVISPEFINSMGFISVLDMTNVLGSNPIVRFSDNENEAIRIYCDMAKRILISNKLHKRQILTNLTSALIYGMSESFASIPPPSLTREERIAKDYVDLVRHNYYTKRKVSEYAEDMCITPGYLSSTVRKVTGKGAAQWIEDYVMMEAKALLVSTDMTIQQISHQLNFTSQSFFGKFFKTYAGVSPRAYREQNQTIHKRAIGD